MASRTLTVRDEVAAIISAASTAATLPETVTVQSVYFAKLDEPLDATDENNPLVRVMPISREVDQSSRSSAADVIGIGIVVQKRMGVATDGQQPTSADILALVELAEAIANLFVPGESASGAEWLRTVHSPLYITDHILSFNLFTSVIQVFYRDDRSY